MRKSTKNALEGACTEEICLMLHHLCVFVFLCFSCACFFFVDPKIALRPDRQMLLLLSSPAANFVISSPCSTRGVVTTATKCKWGLCELLRRCVRVVRVPVCVCVCVPSAQARSMTFREGRERRAFAGLNEAPRKPLSFSPSLPEAPSYKAPPFTLSSSPLQPFRQTTFPPFNPSNLHSPPPPNRSVPPQENIFFQQSFWERFPGVSSGGLWG